MLFKLCAPVCIIHQQQLWLQPMQHLHEPRLTPTHTHTCTHRHTRRHTLSPSTRLQRELRLCLDLLVYSHITATQHLPSHDWRTCSTRVTDWQPAQPTYHSTHPQWRNALYLFTHTPSSLPSATHTQWLIQMHTSFDYPTPSWARELKMR